MNRNESEHYTNLANQATVNIDKINADEIHDSAVALQSEQVIARESRKASLLAHTAIWSRRRDKEKSPVAYPDGLFRFTSVTVLTPDMQTDQYRQPYNVTRIRSIEYNPTTGKAIASDTSTLYSVGVKDFDPKSGKILLANIRETASTIIHSNTSGAIKNLHVDIGTLNATIAIVKKAYRQGFGLDSNVADYVRNIAGIAVDSIDTLQGDGNTY